MSNDAMNNGAIPTIECRDAAAATDVVLLDVREYDEWMSGHAPTATHLAMSVIQDRVDELDKSVKYICVCRSGNRSGQVTAWLRSQGFDATNMTGGMNAWSAAQLPIVNHAGNPGVVI